VKPKTFKLIVGNSAAEQRLVVAHSVSYGFGRPKGSKAPAGAIESYGSTTHFFRPVRGLNHVTNIVPTVVTVGYYRSPLRGCHPLTCPAAS
jgi:hypothetical protein